MVLFDFRSENFWPLSIRNLLSSFLALFSSGELCKARLAVLMLITVRHLLSLRRVRILVLLDNGISDLLRAASLQALQLALQSVNFSPSFFLRRLKLVDPPAEQVVDDLQLVDARAKRVVLRNYSVKALRRFEVVRPRRGEGVGGQRDRIEDVLRRDVWVLVLGWCAAAAE